MDPLDESSTSSRVDESTSGRASFRQIETLKKSHHDLKDDVLCERPPWAEELKMKKVRSFQSVDTANTGLDMRRVKSFQARLN